MSQTELDALELLFNRINNLVKYLSLNIDYLRDGREKLKSYFEGMNSENIFINTISAGWGATIGKCLYLHLLHSHLPSQLWKRKRINFCSCSAQEG